MEVPEYKVIDGQRIRLTESEKNKIKQRRTAESAVQRLRENFPSVSLTQSEKDALAAEGDNAVAIRSEAIIEKARSLRVENAQKPVSYDGSQFDADAAAQQKLTGKLTYAQAIGKDNDSSWSVGWKTANDNFVQLSYTDLENVVEAVNKQIQAAYNREAEILAQVEQATTIEELNAISIESGWP